MKVKGVQLKIRIPAELKRWLETNAATNMRSQNAEIIIALKTLMENESKGEAPASTTRFALSKTK